MKRYKLLKDLPTVKAGTIFQEIVREVDDSRALKEYETTSKDSILISEINNFDEWFEEIKEPTDSIHWEPLPGDIYWYLSNTGVVLKKKWMSSPDDIMRYVIGNTYRTEKECDKAYDRKLAEARLRQTSDFEPDFENGSGGWVVCYRRRAGKLDYIKTYGCDSGEPVRYATMKEAERSIRENREDWLKYFGIKEEE